MAMNPDLETIVDSISKKRQKINTNIIEIQFKRKYDVLGYYKFIDMTDLKNELYVGSIIRYASSVSKLSCAAVVTKIVMKDRDIEYILLGGFVHKGTYWKIYPEHYYIFMYDNRISKLRRSMHRSGIHSLSDIMNEKPTDGLDFNVLMRADPTIKDKIIRNNEKSDASIMADKIISDFASAKPKKIIQVDEFIKNLDKM